jgi:signal transduction histidine kinase
MSIYKPRGVRIRWLPKSLFGRLMFVLLTGLIASQLLGAYVLLRDRGALLYETSGWHIAQRLAGIVQLMNTQTLEQRALTLRTLNTPTFRLTLEDAPHLAHTDESIAAAHLRALFSHIVGGSRPVRAAVVPEGQADEPLAHFGPGMGPMMRMPGPPFAFASRPVAFQVETQLRDGTWVRLIQDLPPDHLLLPYKVLLTLVILLLSVVGLSLLAVRTVTRPLVTLGRAAELLGRDIHRPPLDEERGPEEVRRAAHAFNTMQARIANQIRERERFLAAVSHDLKTPITRLRLRAELVQDIAIRGKIVQDLNDMETMTAATLEFIRGTQQPEDRKLVDITSLLESLQQDHEAMGQKLRLRGSAAPYPTRPMALRRCLENLIDNAINYGNEADITVEDDAHALVILIADQGTGIPDKDLEQVFEPFYRLEKSRSRNTGGVGLGLSIARGLARSSGGDLHLRNRPEGGLEATLILPR